MNPMQTALENQKLSLAFVYVIDDESPMRRAIERILLQYKIPCKLFESAETFLQIAKPDMNGCLILDIRMPGMSGLQLLEVLNARQIELPVIMLSGAGTISLAVTAMRTGAIDFVEKPFDTDYLIDRVFYCLNQNALMQESKRQNEEFTKNLQKLTPRESEVMKLLIQGYTSKHAASKLQISGRTIEIHRARIFSKMQVSSLPNLIRVYLSHMKNY